MLEYKTNRLEEVKENLGLPKQTIRMMKTALVFPHEPKILR